MFRVYAHRGASAELPENTMEAFVRAIERGANAIETDAHLTKDGHVVLSHDADGLRMCGVPRRIADVTLEELRQWDAGFGFRDARGDRPFAGRGHRVPLLSELLEALPDVPVNVDAKHLEVVPALVEVVRRARATDRVLIASFDDRTIARVRALGYEGMTGLARGEALRLLLLPGAVHRVLKLRGRAAQIPDRMRGVDLGSSRIVARCHALGLLVHYWTVDDPARARALKYAGADGVMTNDPARIAPAVL